MSDFEKKLFLLSTTVIQSYLWSPFARILFTLFCHFKVRGIEHLSGLTSPAIFAVNHTHELDSISIPPSLPFLSRFHPIIFLVREAKFYNGSKDFGWRRFIYGGVYFKLVGGFPIQSGKKNYALSLSLHQKMLEEGYSVSIFPSGTISRRREDPPPKAHGGVAYLSRATNVPVIPMHIGGIKNMSFWEFISRRRHLTVRLGKPLYPSDFMTNQNPTVDDYKQGAQKILNTIENLAQ